jgi:signal transduction histidine kinase
MTAEAALASTYQKALAACLSGAGESALSEAYELGRQLLAGGVGLLGLAEIHQRAVREWLATHPVTDNVRVVDLAAAFFAESLSSFEMHFRRIDESSAAWRRVNELLEEEVRRISLAMHNEAGNILAQASLEMDLAFKNIPDELRSRLSVARQLLDETGEQLRHLSHELRPSILDDLGLLPALSFLAEGIEKRTGMRIRVQGNVDRRMRADIELAVYRIAQEAINNALRHAGKSPSVTIRVELVDCKLRCAIADDGVGFSPDEVLADKRRSKLGLLSMRERAAVFGGECRIESHPGGGTRVELHVPV